MNSKALYSKLLGGGKSKHAAAIYARINKPFVRGYKPVPQKCPPRGNVQ